MCPKGHAEKYPWDAAFTAVPIFLISFVLPASMYFERICECMHVSDCLEVVFELQLS
jgi:hypothetical protein